MQKLTALSKAMIAAILLGSGVTAYRTYGGEPLPAGELLQTANAPSATVATTGSAPAAGAAIDRARPPLPKRPLRVAVSQWPGHMALVVAAGGLTTQPGSIAQQQGLDLEISFIEDAPSKNKALLDGDVDVVWQTVDELPIALSAYRARGVEGRAFLQIDWSRGGDACVAIEEVQKVEDIIGRKSAVLMFSPDHTVFEFMVSNSRLTPEQVAGVRKATKFSPDDITFARRLFEEKQVDVACMWEPDVTLALASRPGSHRLFSTADATELVADVLFARRELLEEHPAIAQKLVRAWFGGVAQAERDFPAAARLISTAASRFRDELGFEKTLGALSWVKWTTLADNVRFFGLDGNAPAFDRVYNQADGIWINYPEAEIKDRFAPSAVRDARPVEAVWAAAGKPMAKVEQAYEQEIARSGVAVFTKPVSINFATGSAKLSAEAIALINQQVLPQLQIAGGMYARVEGNTDSTGDYARNHALSESRAAAIVDYLVSRGIAPARLVARGNGPGSPTASNKTPEGRAQNRRTDVLFIRRKA
jgi:NitT/TauT family transport system substrate-binding protein